MAAAQQAKANMAGLGYEGVLSAKAVQVGSGRAVWYYQKSIVDLDDAQQKRRADLLYDARGTALPAPAEHAPGQISTLAAWGGAFTGIGAGVLALGLGLGQADDPDATSLGGKLTTAGAVVAAGGIVMLVLGNRSMGQANDRARAAQGTVSYEPVEAVLCRSQPRQAEAPAAAAVPAPGGAVSDEYVDRTTRRHDTEAERRTKITEKIADDFSRSVQALVGP
ncbi:MAG: hypothetical protein IT376_11480 [Polyangiaceae bacterium]|nr:hypothetical protein [Polyangiaceae bacterium]